MLSIILFFTSTMNAWRKDSLPRNLDIVLKLFSEIILYTQFHQSLWMGHMKLSESSKAVILLRKKLRIGKISFPLNPKDAWKPEPEFMAHKLKKIPTKFNKLKEEGGIEGNININLYDDGGRFVSNLLQMCFYSFDSYFCWGQVFFVWVIRARYDDKESYRRNFFYIHLKSQQASFLYVCPKMAAHWNLLWNGPIYLRIWMFCIRNVAVKVKWHNQKLSSKFDWVWIFFEIVQVAQLW